MRISDWSSDVCSSDLTRMSMLYMSLGTQDELRDQIMDCALDQACLAEPWPDDAASFEQRRVEGKARLGLLAQEICRLAAQILDEWTALQRKLPQARPWADAYADLRSEEHTSELQSLMRTSFDVFC